MPWQAWQDDYASIGKLHAQLGDVGTKVERYEDYIEKVQIKLDELQKKYECKESQQLTNAKELIRELEKKKSEHDLELRQLKEEVRERQ